MRRFPNPCALLPALLALAFAASCQPVPTGNTTSGANATTNTANTNGSSNVTNAPATSNPNPMAAASDLPVTLPVLDAMFADEAFAGELKSRVQLTDEQVERLRKIAREETAALREGEGEEHQGTTSEAKRRANEKIREVVGAEKAQSFTSFVGERWSGGAAALSAKPNSVPSDTRIVVNAPAYRMDVFENGQLVKTYRVGIGYPEFPLPQGERKASSIIFNPTWTPPDEPWVEASGKVKVGQKVEAGSPLNPLGPVKIPIGMPSLIHGGKSAAKLGTFASHGCVGLTNEQVIDVAQVIGRLGGTEIKPEDIAAYKKNKTETRNVKLAREVPVELRYETIVVEDGRLHIYRDVYDRNTNTEENLRAVLEAHGVSLSDLSEPERAQVLEALASMARDAKGNPTDGAATPTPTPSKNANKKDGDRVTRTVKGKKEAVIELAALRGKGYPAPVNLSGGPQPQPQKKAAPKASKRG